SVPRRRPQSQPHRPLRHHPHRLTTRKKTGRRGDFQKRILGLATRPLRRHRLARGLHMSRTLGRPFFVRSPNEKCASCSPSPPPPDLSSHLLGAAKLRLESQKLAFRRGGHTASDRDEICRKARRRLRIHHIWAAKLPLELQKLL